MEEEIAHSWVQLSEDIKTQYQVSWISYWNVTWPGSPKYSIAVACKLSAWNMHEH